MSREAPQAADLLLGRLLERQARRTPDAVALRFEGADLTYAELERRANRLAHHLRALGVGAEVLVGIFAERSFEMVIALLATWKAGGAYVPLDPGYPRSRLEFMLEDSGAPVLLAQRRLMDALPRTDARVVLLDDDRTWGAASEETPTPSNGQDDVAYVIYTSGSTGRPKGAMNTHRGISNRILWMQDRYGLQASDTVVQKTPFSFDVSGWEFFWPLLVGARMVLARPEGHKDPAYLAELIESESVSVCHFVPSMLQAFLEEPDLHDRCASLRHVICSGEALTKPLQDRVFATIDAQLHNLYGPTEAAIDVTHWTCRRDWEENVVPIGRPVANTQIYVVDASGARAAEGESGELWIGGVQVARGYLNREELTRQQFIADPFSDGAGSRVYRTGDLARWRKDGNLEFLGRLDHQVKLHGVRIELGEIEAVLEAQANVRQAAAMVREDAPGQPRLVAYVVSRVSSRGDEPISLESLRPSLQEHLPEAMIPAVLVDLDEMPLTESGKIDRKRLPPPSRERPPLEQPHVAPRGKVERAIARIWGGLLQVDDIGARDPFFALGGNSLLAARFIRLMEEELGENIYIVSIFNAPTVEAYARFLETDYADAVARRYGGRRVRTGRHASGDGRERTSRHASTETIDADAIERMRRCIPVLTEPPPPEPDPEPNPPALFVLAPPRSGTTLLRVMLAGHPRLFAAAELQLLGFHTLAERRRAFSGKFRLWREGALRCLMELCDCDAARAEAMMEGFEAQGFTSKQLYAELQGRIGDRTLVDKSPSYVLDPSALQKAERDFRDPLYIHLTRHPLAMVESFERYHMNQVLFLKQHGFSSRQLAELVWLISHENTRAFLESVPSSRQVRIRYEDLVTDPDETLRTLCRRLGIPFHADLVDPYKDIENKMVDGIHDVSAPMGDTHLLEHGKIDPRLADKWKEVRNDTLSPTTWELAKEFDYEQPESAEKRSQPSRDESRPRERRAALRRARHARARHRRRQNNTDTG